MQKTFTLVIAALAITGGVAFATNLILADRSTSALAEFLICFVAAILCAGLSLAPAAAPLR